MNNMTITMKSVIERAGGTAAFARATGINIHTVKAWQSGKRTHPNSKFAGLLADALEHRRYCHKANLKDKELAAVLRDVKADTRGFEATSVMHLLRDLIKSTADYLDPPPSVGTK